MIYGAEADKLFEGIPKKNVKGLKERIEDILYDIEDDDRENVLDAEGEHGIWFFWIIFKFNN